MPLSDEEARLLHQLEQSLAAEDPDFASTLRGSKLFAHNRKVAVISGLAFLLSVAVMFSGVLVPQVVLGVAGFLGMLVSAYFFLNAFRRGMGSNEEQASAQPTPPKPTGSFVDRMEERWNRRQDGDDYR